MGREAKILIGIAVAVAIGVSAMIVISASKNKPATPSAEGSQLVKSDSHQTKPGAKVTLVEFGDIQCPACGQAQPIVEQIEKQYPDQVNVVFRHFPLRSIHKNAEVAAQAAEAAGEQGKFFEMTSLMYAKQTEWSNDANPLPKFESYAQSLGLDVAKLKAAVEAKKFTELIKRDENDASALGLNSTPTFYVNGTQVQTSQLKATVDAAVQKP
jgi:protein-disulfide isomerase